MKRDIRLYYYEAGQLLKITYPRGRHNFENLLDCVEFVKKYQKTFPKFADQYVIVEYIAPYQSKILKVVDNV